MAGVVRGRLLGAAREDPRGLIQPLALSFGEGDVTALAPQSSRDSGARRLLRAILGQALADVAHARHGPAARWWFGGGAARVTLADVCTALDLDVDEVQRFAQRIAADAGTHPSESPAPLSGPAGYRRGPERWRGGGGAGVRGYGQREASLSSSSRAASRRVRAIRL